MEIKQSLTHAIANLPNFLKVIWNTEVNVGQTGSFHNQRIKDVASEAAISFGRFRLSSGKYWPGFFFSWIRKGLDF